MAHSKVKNSRLSNTGFTIVELLIVIVIIGILAAITIVAYNGIQNRANDTTVQNDLVAMAKKIELEAATTGNYQVLTPATGIRISKSAFDTAENNLYYCRNTNTNKYAIAARSKSKKDYKVVNGALSEHPSKLYGASTCDLVRTSPTETLNAVLGWDLASLSWLNWAQD